MAHKYKIPPIKTWYKGTEFKSRTEAQWAVFFDQMGIIWEYEVDGFPFEGGYLCDFRLRSGSPTKCVWAEVKPFEPTELQREKLAQVCDNDRPKQSSGVFFIGQPGKYCPIIRTWFYDEIAFDRPPYDRRAEKYHKKSPAFAMLSTLWSLDLMEWPKKDQPHVKKEVAQIKTAISTAVNYKFTRRGLA